VPVSDSGKPAAAAPLPNADGTFTLNITQGADIVEQLRVIAFQAQKSIIPSKDVRGALPAMDLYNVTTREALDAILHVNGYAWREKGNFIFVYTAKELDELEKAQRVQNTEVFRVYYTPALNASNMIKPVLSSEGQFSITTPAISGIQSGTSDAGGNSHATEDLIVVTDYPENLDRVRKLLKEIDRRPQQILIEATILRAALTEDNALGMDFTVLGGVDFASLTGAGSSAGGALSGSILGSSNPAAQNVVDKGYVAGGTGLTGNLPQGGLRLGIVQNNIAVFLSALESVTDTTVLANPKVLALNKQRGEVIVGRRDGYLTTTVTDSSAIQTVEFLDTGTRLIFRPFIGDDGYIRMEIHPEDSSGGLTGSNLPFKITTEVTSNVMIRDGHTIVIGGLFRESSDSARGQVPFLGNIPLAGNLFRNQRDRTTREEIIILLTPHIIKDDAAYSRYSEEQLQAAETLRVGMRKGMMPFGRERLAESAYERAVDEMKKPDANKRRALFWLDTAINLNPKFLEAIEMKQDLTNEVVTGLDNSTIRHFVRRQIIAERSRPASATRPVDRSSPEASPSKLPLTESPSTKPSESAQISSSVEPSPKPMVDDAQRLSNALNRTWGWSSLGRYFVDFFSPVGRKFEQAVARLSQPGERSGPRVTELPMDDAVPSSPARGNENK
jgi:type IV pilus assembly protein PilQ